MPGKMKRKEAQALEDAATATSVGVGNIASIALQNEIADISERLSNDPQLAFTLGSLLRDGTLVSMLKGGDYDKDVKAIEKTQKSKGWRSRALRSTAKTMKHLPASVLQRILTGCSPESFPETLWDEDQTSAPPLPPLLSLVNYMLNTSNETKLPYETWPDCKTWGGIVDASIARYASHGRRSAGVAPRDIAGYWSVSAQDPKCVKCSIFPDSPMKPLPWAMDAGQYQFTDAFSWDCKVSFSVSGATFNLTDQFAEAVQLPDPLAAWPSPSSPPVPGLSDGVVVAGGGPGATPPRGGPPAPPLDGGSAAGSVSSIDAPPIVTVTPTKASSAGFSMNEALRQKLQGSGRAGSAKKPLN